MTGTRREFARRASHEKIIRAFTQWREARLREISGRYWALSRAALRAARALAAGSLEPDEQELAWDALARFHNAEAELLAAFDLLMCARAGAWLEEDPRIERLYAMWRKQ